MTQASVSHAATAVYDALGDHVVSVETTPHPYATSHSLHEAHVELAGGRTLTAVVKEATRRPPDRPAFVHDSRRERETYRHVLQPSGAWAPRLLGVSGPYLVLEHVQGVPLWQCELADVAGRLGGTLRSLHDTLADHIDEPFLLRCDRPFYERWFTRAREFDRAVGPLARTHELATARLLSEPTRVIHCELYPSNVIVCDDADVIVDWETAAEGPAVLDLAALLAGWPEAEASALLEAYGAVDPVALDCARLHLAIRWLGWSSRWSPPPQHAHHWSEEARRVALRLERAAL
jgi:aminoglycoside phosphotransferase (APT) family kinase protein